jgi:membrane protease subunit (stomatin/prohibitin family)
MRKFATVLLLVSLFVAGAMAASSRYAQGSSEGSGMMGDMMGMMKMMKQMSDMMDHCNSMMSDSRPNDQWRKSAPSDPERKG